MCDKHLFLTLSQFSSVIRRLRHNEACFGEDALPVRQLDNNRHSASPPSKGPTIEIAAACVCMTLFITVCASTVLLPPNAQGRLSINASPTLSNTHLLHYPLRNQPPESSHLAHGHPNYRNGCKLHLPTHHHHSPALMHPISRLQVFR